MLIKIYEKVKFYIKQNFKFLLIVLFLLLISTIELPYYIEAPGGLLDVSDRLEINDKKLTGSFNLAYVKELKATIPTLFYAFFDKDWSILTKEEVLNNETVEDIDYRNHLMLEEANQNAIIVGFSKANTYFEITNRLVNIVYIYDEANTDLKIGDQIISVNDEVISSKDHLLSLLNEAYGKIKFKVINDNIIYERYAYKVDINDNKLIGIVVCETKQIDTDIDVNFKFKKSESGPSGGFMMALSIYNYLIEEDLTKGLKIVGTGTIDEEGNIGSIGGVSYKVKAAEAKDADLFFVPQENYDEAYDTVINNNLDIRLVKVSNIDEAIIYLKNM